MGACLSSAGDSVTNFALVISPKGELRPYSTPVFVSDVLKSESEEADSSSFFLCNSDNLSYDEHITALDDKHELDAGQIYFVLPISKLRNRLSASEMAALAVKASLALNAKPNAKAISYAHRSRSNSKSKSMAAGGSGSGRKNRSKISPFVVMETSKINVIVDEEEQNKRSLVDKNNNNNKERSSLRVSRSGSIRKFQRYSSTKARLAVRSFRFRLSTIYEAHESSDRSHNNNNNNYY